MRSINKAWVAEARILASISVSVTVTMFAQLAISAVETLIVARLGAPVLAGVTLAISLDILVFLFALGVVTAITPIAAQANGRGDTEGLRRSGQQSLWAGLTFAVPGVAILLGCGRLLDEVLGHSVEAGSAYDYLWGSALGLPAWVSYVAVRSLAVATGRLRVTTIIMLASVPVHAGLTLWFVFGGFFLPPLGALGAGLAYALTGYGACALLALTLWLFPAGDLSRILRRPFVWDPVRYREIIALGIPFACRILLREGVLPGAAFVIAPFGAPALAAHAVAARVVELAGVFSFGFSDAANMRVSHALGAGTPGGGARSGWIAIQLSILVSAVLAITIAAKSMAIAQWVLGDADPTGVAAAAALLPVAAGVLFLDGVQSAAGGALSGMRDAKGPLLIAITGPWCVGMPLGALLAWTMVSPVQGLWLGLALGACLTLVLYLARFQQKIAQLRGRRPIM